MKDYFDFWFVDEKSGEEFFVELEWVSDIPKEEAIKKLLSEANKIAHDNFEAPRLIDVVIPEVAEILGFDTY